MDIESQIGHIHGCYVGHAMEPTVREGAASGGAVSAILMGLLGTGDIDGAVVSRITVQAGRLSAESFLARSCEEILSARTSIYLDFPLLHRVAELRNKMGRFAVVALPCQIRAIEKMKARDPELRKRIVLTIGLFCGHASKPALIHRVLKKEGINESEIKQFYFRKGHWRGQSHLIFKDGSERMIPFLKFGLYQNLYYHCVERCLSCMDQTAEHADMSCGDVWLREMKKNPIKHTGIVSRTRKADELLHILNEKGILHLMSVPPESVMRAQKRALIFKKKNIAARAKLGRMFGFRIRYAGNHMPRINDWIGAFMYLLNVRLSQSHFGESLLFHMPRPLLYVYLAIMKSMINY